MGGVEGYRESGYEEERRCHSTLSLVEGTCAGETVDNRGVVQLFLRCGSRGEKRCQGSRIVSRDTMYVFTQLLAQYTLRLLMVTFIMHLTPTSTYSHAAVPPTPALVLHLHIPSRCSLTYTYTCLTPTQSTLQSAIVQPAGAARRDSVAARKLPEQEVGRSKCVLPHVGGRVHKVCME